MNQPVTTKEAEKPRKKRCVIYCLLIMAASVAFLGFACTKYYIDVAEGFVDELASLFAHAFWIGFLLALAWRRIPRSKRMISSLFCFALILCAIASYKSIKLLGKVSSAKNAIKKFSSILNDVNEGRLISNERITKAQYGELSGFVALSNDWIRDTQMDCEKMNKELEDCNYASIHNPKTLIQSALSSQCHFNFERAELILHQYEEIMRNRFDEFETRIRTSNIPEKLKKRVLSGFKKTKEENLKGILDLLKIREAYVSEAKSFLAFMKKKRTEWKYENDKFSFKSNEDASIFNSHIINFRRFAKEEASLVEKTEQEASEKRKELDQLIK